AAVIAAVPSAPIERLKRSKAQISAEIERKSVGVALPPLVKKTVEPTAAPPLEPRPAKPLADTTAADGESYTSRLLAAKRRARETDRGAD
ncbi:MAG TPA: hypothetical protein PKC18_05300, partial [Lacipirellulaceae bacterium]|nr:hypothetical protein [Lacipirellulaceae bacterium]